MDVPDSGPHTVAVAAQAEVDDRSPSTAEGGRLWGGRFSGQTDPIMEKFNASFPYDKIMYKEDIEGSVAYSRALEGTGLLTAEEGDALRQGLWAVMAEWRAGTLRARDGDEDIHSANERRLTELVGPVGGKLHTGRSRNDQVATDTRLWLMAQIREVAGHATALLKVLVQRAEAEQSIVMVGYTHLQRAQPVRWAHWLLSFAWWLREDLRRLQQCYDSADQCPLGSGALAGNPFGVDRRALAADLGFSRITHNSMMAVADRDFVADFLYFSCLLCTHLSRLAEDISNYSSAEFGMVRLSDAYATGSSLMPQKKNPDSVELIRGKTGTLIGKLTGFLCVLKGLPSTYNKDLQEDKLALFDTVSTLSDLLQIATGVVSTLKVDAKACRKGLSDDMLATDVAYYLVRKGMAFRSAHGMAGQLVKLAEKLNCSLSMIPVDNLRALSPLFTEDISSVWSSEASVEQYTAEGGTAASSVQDQIKLLKEFLMEYSVAKQT